MRYRLRIEDMHCEHCASNIERYLRSQPNIEAAEINYEERSGEIEAPANVDLAELIEAIDAMGYQVTVADSQ